MPKSSHKVAKTSSSTSDAPKQPQDYLSRLPAELLSDIFKLAYPLGEAKPTAPLSKTLLPFFLEVLYLRVKVKTYDNLEKLCATLISVPGRGKLVKALEIIVEGANGKPWGPGEKEDEDPHTPRSSSLVRAFKRLKNLEYLFVAGSTRIATLILGPKVAADCFPRLEVLYLLSTFSTVSDPFHLSQFTNLILYPNLVAFNLVVERTAKSIKPFSKPLQSPRIQFPHLCHVLLEGPLAASPGAMGLMRAFGCVHELELVDVESKQSLVHLLEAVPQPEQIFELKLESSSQAYDNKLEDVLPSFPSVQRLELGGRCCSTRSAFYDALRKLPLKHLVLDDDVDASALELEALVRGPRKHDSLQQLTLDNVYGEVGTSIGEIAPYFEDEYGGPEPHDDWLLPAWTPSFTRAGLEKLLTAAKEGKVEVDGSAVAALTVADEWEDEQALLEEYELEGGFEGEYGCG